MLSVVLAIGIAAAGSQAADAPSYVDRIFTEGERIEMSLAWYTMAGGTLKLEITPQSDGTLKIASLAQTNAFFSTFFKVRDAVDSTVRAGTLSTLRYHKSLREGRRRKEETTIVDTERGIATRKGVEVAVPDPVYDPLSLIYHLRRLELTPGAKHGFTVLADGKVYAIEAEVKKREAISTEAGVFQTVLVEPKMRQGGIFSDEENRMLIWFSDDSRKLPIRVTSEFKAGSITATLRRSRLGGGSGGAADHGTERKTSRLSK